MRLDDIVSSKVEVIVRVGTSSVCVGGGRIVWLGVVVCVTVMVVDQLFEELVVPEMLRVTVRECDPDRDNASVRVSVLSMVRNWGVSVLSGSGEAVIASVFD